MSAYRNPGVVETDMNGTLRARRFAVVAECSEDGFESWWEDVVVARFATRAEAAAYAADMEAA